jgi:hypothetical protein
MSKDAETVRTLAEEMSLRLAGHSPEVQGAVLAYLLSLWIAGHRQPDPVEQGRLHSMLLEMHMAAVKQLIGPGIDSMHGTFDA